MPIYDPSEFCGVFRELRSTNPPPATSCDDDWTEWFGRQMLAMAERFGVFCQNKQRSSVLGASPERDREWMNIDHVFVKAYDYDSFPLVAVEHENGGLAKIQWAFWKVLSMRSKLSVLVAYPSHARMRSGEAIGVLGRMASSWANTYGGPPTCLLLLGWWDYGPVLPEIYGPFVAAQVGGGVDLVPAPP
jgi:hypothetical protein